MKYFIITKKHITILKFTILLLVVIGAGVFLFLNFYPKTVQTFSPSDILREQLPKERKKTDSEKMSEKIIGFSFKNPSSVISEYSPMLENVEIEKSTPEPTLVPKTEEEPKAPEVEIKIEEKTASGTKEIKNQTKYEVSLAEFENEALNINKPVKVLIVHTHTTESYAPEEGSMNFITANSRSCEEERNMIAIGEIIGEELKKQGIEVIHDKTYHDYPVYNGAYGRSLATVKANMEKFSGINVVLDIHRDAIATSDGTPTKLVCDINGEKTAQVMLVVGTNGGGLEHSGWQDNLTFASKIQGVAAMKYPKLMRPLNLREERFNQHTTPCSIIVEVGTNANTLSEAKKGAEKIGECIAQVLVV